MGFYLLLSNEGSRYIFQILQKVSMIPQKFPVHMYRPIDIFYWNIIAFGVFGKCSVTSIKV